MLSFDLRALESKAAQVSDDLPAEDPVWEEGDVRPEGAVHVEGRISAAGDDRFYLSGTVSGTVRLACRRCLADVVQSVEDQVSSLFAPAGDPAAEDDPDIFLYDAGHRDLDIRPAVRESWLLAVPAFAQCSADCKGLCPQCGTDLNTGACTCAPETTDSRWDALRHSAPGSSQA